MQPFGPSPTALFVSWGRGAEASTPPAQDAFRNAFQSRLLARMNSRAGVPGAAERSCSRLGNSQEAHCSLTPPGNSRQAVSRWETGTGRALARYGQAKGGTSPAGSSPGEATQTSAPGEKKLPEVHKTRKLGFQTPVAALATGQSQATYQTPQNQSGSPAANPPQALRDLITFLQSLPGGSLKIVPEQVPAVASYLRSAGLPQEEIDRLLQPSSTQDISLNAADLQAAWQRAQEKGTASAEVPGPSTPQASSAANQPQVAANKPQDPPDIQQTPGYRTLWERLRVPQEVLPTLRLALARLGASPQVLAPLEEKGQGQGIPLTKVWEVLQNVKESLTHSASGDQSGTVSEAGQSQSDVLGSRPVTGADLEEWRQVLLKAGLQPEVVEKLLGQKSPGTQEELQTKLLALAPAEETPPALAEPKPLYQPQNLQMRPFFWQSQNQGDRPRLDGEGTGEKGQNPAAQLAAPSPPPNTGENLVLPTFAAEFQGITQGETGAAAPLSETGTWRLLPPEVRESLWTQLQSGVVSNLGQGENKITLTLNPPSLGQVELTLHLNGQDLAVTAVATRPEVAELTALGMPQLLQALAQQGLVLTQFQVRLQDQPDRPISPVLAGAREKDGDPKGNPSTTSRRRSGEVDRFV